MVRQAKIFTNLCSVFLGGDWLWHFHFLDEIGRKYSRPAVNITSPPLSITLHNHYGITLAEGQVTRFIRIIWICGRERLYKKNKLMKKVIDNQLIHICTGKIIICFTVNIKPSSYQPNMAL